MKLKNLFFILVSLCFLSAGVVFSLLLADYCKSARQNTSAIKLFASLPAEGAFVQSGESFSAMVSVDSDGDEVEHFLVAKFSAEGALEDEYVIVYDKKIEKVDEYGLEFTFPEVSVVSGEEPVNVDFFIVRKDGCGNIVDSSRSTRLSFHMLPSLDHGFDSLAVK